MRLHTILLWGVATWILFIWGMWEIVRLFA